MEEYEKIGDLGYGVAIESILYSIEGKKDLTDVRKTYIDWTKGYIERINGSLDSILDESYIFTPHLIEMIETLSGKSKEKISIEDIVRCKEEFSLMSDKLENLKTNTQEFYKSEDSKYIFNFMKKIKPFFETSHVPIMTCCGEDIDKDD